MQQGVKVSEIVDCLSDGTAVRQAKLEAESARQRMKTVGADTLQRIEFEPLQMPVNGLIVEGLTLLCGASKIGKSWLMMDLCCCVASGRPFLGRQTEAGSVLYLALEDSDRRLQQRLAALNESQTSALQFATSARTVNTGLLDDLRDWTEHVDEPRLIVVDTLQKVRDVTPGRANAYAEDYALMGQLKQFADTQHIAVVLVHHLNKMRDVSDPFERISGSTGLMGAADTTILLDRARDTQDAKLTYTGRDVYGDDICLRFAAGRWCVIGADVLERESYAGNPLTRTVKSLLDEAFGDSVTLTAESLKEAVAQRTGTCVAGTVTRLARDVSALAPDLQRYDGITVERTRNGTQRGYKFLRARKGEGNVR